MLPDKATKPPARDAAVDAAIRLLAEPWPACFSVYERRWRPLALGVHHGILAALDGAVTPQELRRALRFYAARIDLDGCPAGTVSAEEAATAAARLATHKRRRRQASSILAPVSMPALPPTLGPKRIGLADLRRAAQLRKAAAA